MRARVIRDFTTDAGILGYLARITMRDGKLARTQTHLSQMLEQITKSTASPPVPLLRQALDIVSPSIRIVNRKAGTKVVQSPQPLNETQRMRAGWKAIVAASEKRADKMFGNRLAFEVVSVLEGDSEAIKKKAGKHTEGVKARANVGR